MPCNTPGNMVYFMLNDWAHFCVILSGKELCMYSSAYVWAKVLSNMEERLGSVPISTCFDDAEVVELNENNLIIYSPSDFRRDIIRRRYSGYVSCTVSYS